ncbi:arsenate reductase ArsC [Candidatus Nitrosotenuis chungbukensis]|uniref:arsenate reductase ArsC n=2 Tax=Candidatus Nitrosotenuis chungbukensis TaxID=1353246 RepID=UPI0009769AD2|nr:arsenate reductase ArsC [Candidatus Nitrosotenuis chungbukensis]WKT58244.1 arsenate reductase ArsC [Candidatus Nitrosotenuis chungbukensis]
MQKKVLFVCVENAGRSQMAEGFFRKYAPVGYEPQSAGTRPVDTVNPLAIAVMSEIGIDISNHQSKVISDSMIKQSARIVNMGCMDKESCPAIFVQNVLDWGIPDPKGKPLDEVRKIRDLIEKKVIDLCKALE